MSVEETPDRRDEVRLRPYRPGDEHAILETFNLVFREVCGEGFVDRTLDEWRWEFARNPEGLRIVIGVCADGTVACQYAGVPLRVWAGGERGEELRFFHAVDSMVHPDFRRGLRKRSLFVEVAERFFAMYGGSADALGFGYPVETAWRIGERFLGYRLVRVIDYLRRPVGGPREPSAVRVERCDGFPSEVDDLWQGVRDRFALTTVRDRRYLTWRYGDRPNHRYTILLAHRGNDLRGFAVVATDRGLVPGAATIGDLLVEPGDAETLAALVDEADRLADERDCTHLMTVENPTLANARAFEALGFVPEPSAQWLERKLGARDWTSGFDPEWLRENWAYALGDSDLF